MSYMEFAQFFVTLHFCEMLIKDFAIMYRKPKNTWTVRSVVRKRSTIKGLIKIQAIFLHQEITMNKTALSNKNGNDINQNRYFSIVKILMLVVGNGVYWFAILLAHQNFLLHSKANSQYPLSKILSNLGLFPY